MSFEIPHPHLLDNTHASSLKPTRRAARIFNIAYTPTTGPFATLETAQPKNPTINYYQSQPYNLHLAFNKSDATYIETEPVIMYDKIRITENVRVYKEGLEELNFMIAPCVKVIAKKILEHVAVLGCGAVVGNINDLRLAIEAGFQQTKCIFNGNGKSLEDFVVAEQEGVLVNVHNDIDLNYIIASAARIPGRRVNILLPISEDTAEPMFIDVVRANPDQVKLVGFHYPLGTTIPEVDQFVNSTFNMVRCIDQIRAQGTEIEILYIGGGLATECFHTGGNFPHLMDLIHLAREMIQSRDIKLIVDPGKGLLVKTCCLITKVTASSAKSLTLFDGNIQELPHDNYYDFELFHRTEPDVGHMAFDVVDSIDGLVVHNAGPYCESMAATSIHRIPSTDYCMVEGNGSVSEIRDGEIFDTHVSPKIYLCSCINNCGLHNILFNNIYPS